MRDGPPELIAIIAADDCPLSDKAVHQYLEYGYTDADALEVAQTGYLHKKTSDETLDSDYVWTFIGNDTSGRPTYMAGKVVIRNGKKRWFIITIHPTRRPSIGLRR